MIFEHGVQRPHGGGLGVREYRVERRFRESMRGCAERAAGNFGKERWYLP